MKTAIITMAYGDNYGNRLQNYALQTLLNSLDCEVVTMRHQLSVDPAGYHKIMRFAKDIIKRFLGRYDILRARRKKAFKCFNKKYIIYSPEVFGNNEAPFNLGEKYDYFIVGSDQVWNTEFSDIASNINIFLASFADPYKRLSYAASFGQDYILPEYRALFERELPKFKAISVREETGISLVEMCGAKADVVLDPTMMLHIKQWNKIANKPKYLNDTSYILTYFLGDTTIAMREFINNFADGRRVINLFGGNTDAIQDRTKIAYYLTAPDEFVWLFAHADCVLTNSFHGSVFSILYHRPFAVYDRQKNSKASGMEGRIETLLKKFGLEQCRGYQNSPNVEPQGGDWEEMERILLAERIKSMEFLRNNLGLINREA